MVSWVWQLYTQAFECPTLGGSPVLPTIGSDPLSALWSLGLAQLCTSGWAQWLQGHMVAVGTRFWNLTGSSFLCRPFSLWSPAVAGLFRLPAQACFLFLYLAIKFQCFVQRKKINFEIRMLIVISCTRRDRNNKIQGRDFSCHTPLSRRFQVPNLLTLVVPTPHRF